MNSLLLVEAIQAFQVSDAQMWLCLTRLRRSSNLYVVGMPIRIGCEEREGAHKLTGGYPSLLALVPVGCRIAQLGLYAR